jgi:hypothetical protein
MREEVGVALVAAAAVVTTALTALVFEALTDRDWSIGDWEWLEVTGLALLSSFGAIWLIVTVGPNLRVPKRGSLRALRLQLGPSLHPSPSPEPVGSQRVEVANGAPSHSARRLTPRRVVSAAYRRIPRAPFRWLMPTSLWRGAFRFWLSVLAADPIPRRGVKDLLIAYDDAYRAVDQASSACIRASVCSTLEAGRVRLPTTS